MMDWKLVSAFAAGAVLASGIVYFAVRPADVAPKQVVVQAPVPRQTPQIAPVPPPPIARAPRAEVHVPVREKPSPVPPPGRREKPVTIASYDPPPPAPTPAPALVAPSSTPQIAVTQPPPAPKVQVRVPNVVTLAAGMTLAVRIGETVSSSRNHPGDSFIATLTQPLVIDGFVIAE